MQRSPIRGHRPSFPSFHRLALAVIIAGALSSTAAWSTKAHAGELRFGDAATGGLSTDDQGRLTKAGRKSVIQELDHIPGEDAWELDVWVKIDRGHPGDAYVEFFHKFDGRESLVHRHIANDYDGEKFVHWQIRLEGNIGFNKNTSYRVVVAQQLENGKELKHAQGRIKLVKNRENLGNADPQAESAGEGGEASSDEALADQDALDTLSGPNEDPEAETPPPIDPANRGGCRSSGDLHDQLPFALALFGLAMPLAARRRD